MDTGPFSRNPEVYQKAVRQLENGQYDQLVKTLESAWEQHVRKDDSCHEDMLIAARHISIACSKISKAMSICGLRHTLSKVNPEYSYVLYKDGCYMINTELNVWIDYEYFLEHFKAAQNMIYMENKSPP